MIHELHAEAAFAAAYVSGEPQVGQRPEQDVEYKQQVDFYIARQQYVGYAEGYGCHHDEHHGKALVESDGQHLVVDVGLVGEKRVHRGGARDGETPSLRQSTG